MNLRIAICPTGWFVNVVARSPAAKVLQARLLAFLAARVATQASLAVGLQIARKVLLAVEVAVASGCALSCGAPAAARALIEVTRELGEAASELQATTQAVGASAQQFLGELFAKPVLFARAQVDPGNIVLSPSLGSTTRADLSVLLHFIWTKLGPEAPERFVASVNRPLSTLAIPMTLLVAIARGLHSSASRRSGLDIVVSAELLRGLDPAGFVQLLRLPGAASFVTDPELVASRQLAAGP